MIFSKTSEYAIKASICIAKRSMDGLRTNLKDISREIESPEAFTAKILQQLVKNDIVRSVKGALGGFEIDQKKLNRIMLADIIVAVDGPLDEKHCALGLKKCSETKPCPVHAQFGSIRNEISKMLHNTSLIKLSTDFKNGITVLKQ